MSAFVRRIAALPPHRRVYVASTSADAKRALRAAHRAGRVEWAAEKGAATVHSQRATADQANMSSSVAANIRRIYGVAAVGDAAAGGEPPLLHRSGFIVDWFALAQCDAILGARQPFTFRRRTSPPHPNSHPQYFEHPPNSHSRPHPDPLTLAVASCAPSRPRAAPAPATRASCPTAPPTTRCAGSYGSSFSDEAVHYRGTTKECVSATRAPSDSSYHALHTVVDGQRYVSGWSRVLADVYEQADPPHIMDTYRTVDPLVSLAGRRSDPR